MDFEALVSWVERAVRREGGLVSGIDFQTAHISSLLGGISRICFGDFV